MISQTVRTSMVTLRAELAMGATAIGAAPVRAPQ
jgi:hypothetical protein